MITRYQLKLDDKLETAEEVRGVFGLSDRKNGSIWSVCLAGRWMVRVLATAQRHRHVYT